MQNDNAMKVTQETFDSHNRREGWNLVLREALLGHYCVYDMEWIPTEITEALRYGTEEQQMAVASEYASPEEYARIEELYANWKDNYEETSYWLQPEHA